MANARQALAKLEIPFENLPALINALQKVVNDIAAQDTLTDILKATQG